LKTALSQTTSPEGTDWLLKCVEKHTLLAHGVDVGVADVEVVGVVSVVIVGDVCLEVVGVVNVEVVGVEVVSVDEVGGEAHGILHLVHRYDISS